MLETTQRQAKYDSNKGRQEDSKAGKKRLSGRQGNIIRQARKDSIAGTKRLNSRQQKTPRQARKNYKAGKKRLKGSQEKTRRQPRIDSKGRLYNGESKGRL